MTSSYNLKLRLRAVAIVLAGALLAGDAAWAVPGGLESVLPAATGLRLPVRMNLPDAAAWVEDGWAAPGSSANRLVVLIHDAHTNPSGQTNLRAALEAVIEPLELKTVYLEAGRGDLSLAGLGRAARPERARAAADAWMKRGLLQGAEHLSLTGGELEFGLRGVENRAAYERAIKIYRESLKVRPRARTALAKIERTLRTVTAADFMPAAAEFIEKAGEYRQEKISPAEYARFLHEAAGRTGVPDFYYPNLKSLHKLQRKEASIDFEKVAEEFDRLTALTGSAGASGDQSVAGGSAEIFKVSSGAGHADPGAMIFLLLKKAPARSGEFRTLKRYAAYRRAWKKVDLTAALKEMDTLESRLVDRVTSPGRERRAAECFFALWDLKRLVELEADPDTWERFRHLPARLEAEGLSAWLNRRIMDAGRGEEFALFSDPKLERAVRLAADFYRLADRRDRFFVGELDRQMSARGESRAVLVTGGFHAKNLKRLLRDRGISFVSVIPRVHHATDRARYEKILLNRPASAGPRIGRADTLMPLPVRAVASRLAELAQETGVDFRRISTPQVSRIPSSFAARLAAAKRLTNSFEVRPGHLDLVEDFPDQSLSEVFALVHGNHGGATVHVSEDQMTAFLADGNEADLFELGGDFSGFERMEPAQARTSWTPTNFMGLGYLGDALMQSRIASRTRSISTASDRAWVWQPRSPGTDATRMPSSSSSIRTKNPFDFMQAPHLRVVYPLKQADSSSGANPEAIPRSAARLAAGAAGDDHADLKSWVYRASGLSRESLALIFEGSGAAEKIADRLTDHIRLHPDQSDRAWAFVAAYRGTGSAVSVLSATDLDAARMKALAFALEKALKKDREAARSVLLGRRRFLEIGGKLLAAVFSFPTNPLGGALSGASPAIAITTRQGRYALERMERMISLIRKASGQALDPSFGRIAADEIVGRVVDDSDTMDSDLPESVLSRFLRMPHIVDSERKLLWERWGDHAAAMDIGNIWSHAVESLARSLGSDRTWVTEKEARVWVEDIRRWLAGDSGTAVETLVRNEAAEYWGLIRDIYAQLQASPAERLSSSDDTPHGTDTGGSNTRSLNDTESRHTRSAHPDESNQNTEADAIMRWETDGGRPSAARLAGLVSAPQPRRSVATAFQTQRPWEHIYKIRMADRLIVGRGSVHQIHFYAMKKGVGSDPDRAWFKFYTSDGGELKTQELVRGNPVFVDFEEGGGVRLNLLEANDRTADVQILFVDKHYVDEADFAERFKLKPADATGGRTLGAKSAYDQRSVREVVDHEIVGAQKVLEDILRIRDWMDANGAQDRPLVLWQNLRLGELYPLMTPAIRSKLGLVEVRSDEVSEWAKRPETIRDEVKQARIAIVKYRQPSSPLETGRPNSEWVESFIRWIRGMKAAGLMIDNGRNGHAYAQILFKMDVAGYSYWSRSRSKRTPATGSWVWEPLPPNEKIIQNPGQLADALHLLKEDGFFGILHPWQWSWMDDSIFLNERRGDQDAKIEPDHGLVTVAGRPVHVSQAARAYYARRTDEALLPIIENWLGQPRSAARLAVRGAEHILVPGNDWSEMFTNRAAPLVVEVGFGSGRELVRMVRQNPDTNYVGIENGLSAIASIAGELNRLTTRPRNLVIAYANDMEVFGAQKDQTAQTIVYTFTSFVYTSALTVPRGARELARILAPGGKLYISSDEDLRPEIRERLVNAGLIELNTPGDFPHPSDSFPEHERTRVVFQKAQTTADTVPSAARLAGSADAEKIESPYEDDDFSRRAGLRRLEEAAGLEHGTLKEPVLWQIPYWHWSHYYGIGTETVRNFSRIREALTVELRQRMEGRGEKFEPKDADRFSDLQRLRQVRLIVVQDLAGKKLRDGRLALAEELRVNPFEDLTDEYLESLPVSHKAVLKIYFGVGGHRSVIKDRIRDLKAALRPMMPAENFRKMTYNQWEEFHRRVIRDMGANLKYGKGFWAPHQSIQSKYPSRQTGRGSEARSGAKAPAKTPVDGWTRLLRDITIYPGVPEGITLEAVKTRMGSLTRQQHAVIDHRYGLTVPPAPNSEAIARRLAAARIYGRTGPIRSNSINNIALESRLRLAGIRPPSPRPIRNDPDYAATQSGDTSVWRMVVETDDPGFLEALRQSTRQRGGRLLLARELTSGEEAFGGIEIFWNSKSDASEEHFNTIRSLFLALGLQEHQEVESADRWTETVRGSDGVYGAETRKSFFVTPLSDGMILRRYSGKIPRHILAHDELDAIEEEATRLTRGEKGSDGGAAAGEGARLADGHRADAAAREVYSAVLARWPDQEAIVETIRLSTRLIDGTLRHSKSAAPVKKLARLLTDAVVSGGAERLVSRIILAYVVGVIADDSGVERAETLLVQLYQKSHETLRGDALEIMDDFIMSALSTLYNDRMRSILSDHSTSVDGGMYERPAGIELEIGGLESSSSLMDRMKTDTYDPMLHHGLFEGLFPNVPEFEVRSGLLHGRNRLLTALRSIRQNLRLVHHFGYSNLHLNVGLTADEIYIPTEPSDASAGLEAELPPDIDYLLRLLMIPVYPHTRVPKVHENTMTMRFDPESIIQYGRDAYTARLHIPTGIDNDTDIDYLSRVPGWALALFSIGLEEKKSLMRQILGAYHAEGYDNPLVLAKGLTPRNFWTDLHREITRNSDEEWDPDPGFAARMDRLRRRIEAIMAPRSGARLAAVGGEDEAEGFGTVLMPPVKPGLAGWWKDFRYEYGEELARLARMPQLKAADKLRAVEGLVELLDRAEGRRQSMLKWRIWFFGSASIVMGTAGGFWAAGAGWIGFVTASALVAAVPVTLAVMSWRQIQKIRSDSPYRRMARELAPVLEHFRGNAEFEALLERREAELAQTDLIAKFLRIMTALDDANEMAGWHFRALAKNLTPGGVNQPKIEGFFGSDAAAYREAQTIFEGRIQDLIQMTADQLSAVDDDTSAFVGDHSVAWEIYQTAKRRTLARSQAAARLAQGEDVIRASIGRAWDLLSAEPGSQPSADDQLNKAFPGYRQSLMRLVDRYRDIPGMGTVLRSMGDEIFTDAPESDSPVHIVLDDARIFGRAAPLFVAYAIQRAVGENKASVLAFEHNAGDRDDRAGNSGHSYDLVMRIEGPNDAGILPGKYYFEIKRRSRKHHSPFKDFRLDQRVALDRLIPETADRFVMAVVYPPNQGEAQEFSSQPNEHSRLSHAEFRWKFIESEVELSATPPASESSPGMISRWVLDAQSSTAPPKIRRASQYDEALAALVGLGLIGGLVALFWWIDKQSDVEWVRGAAFENRNARIKRRIEMRRPRDRQNGPGAPGETPAPATPPSGARLTAPEWALALTQRDGMKSEAAPTAVAKQPVVSGPVGLPDPKNVAHFAWRVARAQPAELTRPASSISIPLELLAEPYHRSLIQFRIGSGGGLEAYVFGEWHPSGTVRSLQAGPATLGISGDWAEVQMRLMEVLNREVELKLTGSEQRTPWTAVVHIDGFGKGDPAVAKERMTALAAELNALGENVAVDVRGGKGAVGVFEKLLRPRKTAAAEALRVHFLTAGDRAGVRNAGESDRFVVFDEPKAEAGSEGIFAFKPALKLGGVLGSAKDFHPGSDEFPAAYDFYKKLTGLNPTESEFEQLVTEAPEDLLSKFAIPPAFGTRLAEAIRLYRMAARLADRSA